MREVIATENGPKAIGPYSQAIKANGFVFVSGQVAIDPATQQVIGGDVASQTDRVLQNLSSILKAAGTSLEKSVRCFLAKHGRFCGHERGLREIFSFGPASAVDGRSSALAERRTGRN
jgi:2-iminobutanoate/2-iminopropanoate deaminase